MRSFFYLVKMKNEVKIKKRICEGVWEVRCVLFLVSFYLCREEWSSEMEEYTKEQNWMLRWASK